MVKLLPVVAVIILAAVVYFRWFYTSNEATPTPSSTITKTFFPNQPAPVTTDTNLRLTNLEAAIIELAKKIASISNTSSDTKIKTLQTDMADLQNRLARLERGGSAVPTAVPTVTASTNKSPVYIPLGGGISNDDQNWSKDNLCCQISIDPADYPGYSNIQLEATTRVDSSGGEGHVRLYNVTDSTEISSSDIYTTSNQNSLITSNGFKLAAGRKTYGIQTKTTSSKTEYLQTARLKVNF